MKSLRHVNRGIMNRARVVGNVLKYTICRMLPCLDNQESWVICERGTDARDNGYAFYQYMIKMHPEIRIHYLITRNSEDFSKVANHAVIYGSMRNYWVVAKASRIVSTHCYTALPVKHEKTWRMLGLAKRFCFLQHGIIMGKIPYVFGDRTGMRLFCCAALPEYTYIKEHYRHPEEVVQCTGFSRYDKLIPFTTKQQILVMPTWRRYLKNEKTFLESDYFHAWNALLQDKRLQEYLIRTQTRLVFYPHYELQPYLQHFFANNSQIELADIAHYDVQQLLKESKLLVTDYSSVHFDFAYMEKPCVYYQFDVAQYHQQHYQEGYFHFEKDGFGPVVNNHEELVEQILSVAENMYRMQESCRKKVDSFFAHHDQNNCERIYQAIRNT